jgi:hypothetical protein
MKIQITKAERECQATAQLSVRKFTAKEYKGEIGVQVDVTFAITGTSIEFDAGTYITKQDFQELNEAWPTNKAAEMLLQWVEEANE